MLFLKLASDLELRLNPCCILALRFQFGLHPGSILAEASAFLLNFRPCRIFFGFAQAGELHAAELSFAFGLELEFGVVSALDLEFSCGLAPRLLPLQFEFGAQPGAVLALMSGV